MNYSKIDVFINSVLSKNPEELVLLDLRELSSVSDFFIICHGESSRKVESIAKHIKFDLKEKGILPLNIEGMKHGRWIVLDYNIVVFHVFQKFYRDYYDLEGLWVDAKKFKIDS